MENKQFDIDASVVFRLGNELITDEIQALVELVKNAYDADATRVRVTINTKDFYDSNSNAESPGYIIIEDNGHGMTEDIIDRGWLFLSNSPKLEMKLNNKQTNRGRTPLGDKGLGRLGVQRLGSMVEIITRPEGSEIQNQFYVKINWKEFEKRERLSNINVKFERQPVSRKVGTTLIISNLSNANIWSDKDRQYDLQLGLSKMISPFYKIRDFFIAISINGVAIDLASIPNNIRDTAPLRYVINFKNGALHAAGAVKLSYLNPSRKDMPLFRQIIEADNGKAFLEFLKDTKQGLYSQFDMRLSASNTWAFEFDFKKNLDDFDKLEKVINKETGKEESANPGDFEGEISFFYLNSPTQNIFDRVSQYKQYIKHLSGIRIYRDGFGVRVDEDWLGLRSSQTSAASVFVLRPDNTIGYIALTSNGNSNLRETTDREGFIKNAYFNNFYEMLHVFVLFTERVQELLRRGWVAFKRDYERQSVRLPDQHLTPEKILKDLGAGEKERGNIESDLRQSAENLRLLAETSNTIKEKQTALTTQDIQQLQKAFETVEASVKYLDKSTQYAQYYKVLAGYIEQFQEQLALSYETMSLGLTAESLTHEINQIINQLLFRTQKFTSYVKQSNLTDSELLIYIEYVRSSMQGLRRQMAHFSPALRYVRENRQIIKLGQYATEIESYYSGRFSNSELPLQLQINLRKDFNIKINKGKLTQIVDNLVLNSEYWVKESLNNKYISQGQITLEIEHPYLRIYDNGRGIDPSVESSLFEPFITTKKSSQGRGLGLFIVAQLLDSEGCTINLLTNRNQFGRFYIFEINFSSIVE